MTYVSAIENSIGKKAIKNYLPMQPGDVGVTAADTSELEEWINFKPSTTVDYGVSQFVNWYRNFYAE